MNKVAHAGSTYSNACNYMHYITDTIKDIEYHDTGKRTHYINQACLMNTNTNSQPNLMHQSYGGGGTTAIPIKKEHVNVSNILNKNIQFQSNQNNYGPPA